jgi:hypothetical protein
MNARRSITAVVEVALVNITNLMGERWKGLDRPSSSAVPPAHEWLSGTSSASPTSCRSTGALRARRHLDQRLARSGHRIRHLGGDEHLRPAELPQPHRAHAFRSTPRAPDDLGSAQVARQRGPERPHAPQIMAVAVQVRPGGSPAPPPDHRSLEGNVRFKRFGALPRRVAAAARHSPAPARRSAEQEPVADVDVVAVAFVGEVGAVADGEG